MKISWMKSSHYLDHISSSSLISKLKNYIFTMRAKDSPIFLYTFILETNYAFMLPFDLRKYVNSLDFSIEKVLNANFAKKSNEILHLPVSSWQLNILARSLVVEVWKILLWKVRFLSVEKNWDYSAQSKFFFDELCLVWSKF